jgi:hypothetical protein
MPEIKFCAICGEPSQYTPCKRCLEEEMEARERIGREALEEARKRLEQELKEEKKK